MKRFEPSEDVLRTAAPEGRVFDRAVRPALMDRVTAIVLAVSICLAVAVGTSLAATDSHEPTMSVQGEENTSRYLAPQPDDIDRSGAQTATLDVAGAVGANAGDVRATYRRVSLERALREAESDQERRAVLHNGTERLAERVDTLERRHDAAIAAYAAGDIGERELFRTLATVNREAEAVAETAEWLEERTRALGMTDERVRLSEQRVRLLPLGGPVRSVMSSGLDGAEPPRVHVLASDGGLVLATVEREGGDDMYVREAYDSSIRSFDSTDRYGGIPPNALERVEELYPWVRENSGSLTADFIGTNGGRIYAFDIDHAHGNLRTHLDGGSDAIVRETQRKDLELVPTTTVEERSETANVRLTVETTHPGGPLGIALVDDAGTPLDAQVTVNGDPVGSTGGERLWTVAPRGTVTVNATHDGERLTVETTVE